MTSVFISYSSKDVRIAECIQECLEHDGFNVWRDNSRIETDWSKEIAGALSRQALEKLPITLRNLDATVVKSNNNVNPDIMEQIIKKIKDTAATNIEYDYKILPPNRDIPFILDNRFTDMLTG